MDRLDSVDSAFRPLVRTVDIVVSEIDGEVLVYDLVTHHSCCLNPSASKLFSLCDGNNTISDLTRQLAVDTEVVLFGLDGLERAGLLAVPLPAHLVTTGMTRRQIVKRIGIGAAMVLPMIAAFSSPAAAAGVCSGVNLSVCVPNSSDLNPDGCPCTGNTQCQGVCPIAPGNQSGFCLGSPGGATPFCAPGNTSDLSADCCPCTGNNECQGVCPIAPGNQSGFCAS